MNPGFCGDEMKDKADPERDAKKFMGGQTRKAARSEEDSNDWADSCDCKTHGKSANHPLAVQRDFTPLDMPKRLAQSD